MTLIDWDVAVNTGVRLGAARSAHQPCRSPAGSGPTAGTLRGRTEPCTRVHGVDQSRTGGPATIVDRPGWIRANVDGFRVVLEPVLEALGSSNLNNSPVSTLTTAVGSRVTGAQLGAVLAYLAGRVLGQYELFLPPDPEGKAPTGRLTLVAPNIVHAEQELNVDPHDFRLWVCLHEETHRTQFTANPWLRGYVQQLITDYLRASHLSAGDFVERLRAVGEAVSEVIRGNEANLIDIFQTEEQSEILDRITAVMTLAEGHGDYVMDAVGPQVVPSVAEIRRRFERRRHGGNRIDKAIRQLLGLDLKLKQYEEGAAFVRTVVARVGMADFNRIWESPETLPTLNEIRDPQAWIARVINPPLPLSSGEEPETE